MSKLSLTYGLAILICCASTISFAQEVDYKLQEVQIKGNLLTYYQEDSREEVLDSIFQSRLSFSSLGDLLLQHGGILVSSYGSRGSLSSVKIRGTGENHTRLHWNGMPVNSLTTGSVDASLIPSGFMEKVSITKGASGVLAGNASFGGAIHLNNTADWSQKYSVSMNTEIGSFGYRALMPSILLSAENIQYKASFQIIKSDNDFPYNDIYKPGAPEVNQTNDSLSQWGLVQNLYIRLKGNLDIDIGMWLQNKDKDIPAVMGSYQSGLANQKDRSNKSYIKLTKVFRSSRILVQAAYLKDSLIYTKMNPDKENDFLIDSHIGTRSFFTRSEWRWFISDKISLDLAAHSEHPKAWVDSYGTVKNENRVSLISAAKFRQGPWIVNIGLRKEFNPYNPPKPLASFGVSWKSKNKQHLLRGNISNKFRIPSFNERYWQPGGNPDLLPESGWGGELGWKWRKTFGVRLTSQIEPVFFYQKIVDWIQWVPSEGYWFPQNQDLMISRGFELSGLTGYEVGKWKFTVPFKYSYTDASQAEYDQPDDFISVLYVPKHQASSGLTGGFGNISTGINYQFIAKRYNSRDKSAFSLMDPVHLLNTHVSFKHNLKQLEFEYYIQINNLLSYDYQMIRSYATPGISGVLGLKVKFNEPQKID